MSLCQQLRTQGIRAVGEVHGRLRWESSFQSSPERMEALMPSSVTEPLFPRVKLGVMMTKVPPLGTLGG